MPPHTAYHGELGDHFARIADTSPYNAYTDRPAMLALAGDVAGLKVLDVGCGAGHYAAELLARGAEVVGIDGSATLLAHARERLGDRPNCACTMRRSRWTSSARRPSTESCAP